MYHPFPFPDSQIANPAFTPLSRLGAAVGISNNHVYIHGGAPASNGYASSGVYSDFTKMVNDSNDSTCTRPLKTTIDRSFG